MSNYTSEHDKRPALWVKFQDQKYRESFVSNHLITNISAQIFCTREARGWTQQQLADAASMAQTRISLMENSSYESYSINTPKRLASAFDVALVVRFVPYSQLLDWAAHITPDQLAVRDFKKDSLFAPADTNPPTTIDMNTPANEPSSPATTARPPTLRLRPREPDQEGKALNQTIMGNSVKRYHESSRSA